MPTAKSAPLRIAMAQINPVLGDLDGNSQLILGAVKEALVSGADVILFSEMVLTGYPVEDLALRPAFQKASSRRVNELAEEIAKIGGGELLTLIGYLDHNEKSENALAAIYQGKVVGKYVKHHLPNYGVFDEFRNFGPGWNYRLAPLAIAPPGKAPDIYFENIFYWSKASYRIAI
ncbi:MAG: hypothetical protein EBU45_05615 [Actinobacteria bacterium]|nr:hypothetical protein [Actinomycetota bacterium]